MILDTVEEIVEERSELRWGLGGESWGYIRISIKKNSSFQHCVLTGFQYIYVYFSSSNTLIDFQLIKNMICDVWKNGFSLRVSSCIPRSS